MTTKLDDIYRYIIFMILAAAVTGPSLAADFNVTALRCEYLADARGIDNPLPRFTWQIVSDKPGTMQASYQITVGTDSVLVANGKGNSWQTGILKSEINLVTYAGTPLQPFTRYYWRVSVRNNDNRIASKTAGFETGIMKKSNWRGTWISDGHGIEVKPAPYFRKQFATSKKVRTAQAYISAAGLYELFINGKRIGDHVLDPMFTNYDRRNLYVTYDVTEALQPGQNALGVVLGNGWYNFQSSAVWDFERAPWRNRPAFCMDLRITYVDGTTETIASGKSWKTATGPIIYNSIYTGEHYDARKEMRGWNTIDFDDSRWKQVIIRQAPSSNIVSQAMTPVRKVEELKAENILKKNDSTWVIDFGRNISGISQLTLDGDSNTIVRVKHGERLDSAGNVDQSNVDYFLSPQTRAEDPFATDIYYLAGNGPQTFSPHFDYKGFRYIQVVSNRPVTLSKESAVAWFMHSDVPPAGRIQTSSDLLNKIYAATNASYLSNLFGYPTDCPQREKNGWTGDAHIAVETGLYNFDAITVYEKWLADLRDEQQPNGVLPSIVPTDGWGYEWGNGPDWTSAIAIIPWNVYLFYGDPKILSDNYDNIKRYVDYITGTAPGGLTDWGLGDWAPLKSVSPKELTSSVYYYTDALILAKAAKILHKTNDHNKYLLLAKKIKDAINAKYLDAANGVYGSGYQTEQAVPLYWGIVPESLQKKVAAKLAEAVRSNNNHLDVGILGAKAILQALSDHGQAETAFRLAAQKDFPSWGWWIVNGATTLYENWNIDLKRDLSMNHIMFGEIGAWFFKGPGGIKPDEKKPGFKNVLLSPDFVGGLDSFRAEHAGPYGRIVSSWVRSAEGITYHVEIPPNSTATITLSNQDTGKVYFRGKEKEAGKSFTVESGIYDFIIR